MLQQNPLGSGQFCVNLERYFRVSVKSSLHAQGLLVTFSPITIECVGRNRCRDSSSSQGLNSTRML